MKATVKTIDGQASWIIRTSNVELAVTQLGGHMAPVRFYRNDKSPVQPYFISPWQREKVRIDDPVLRPLRGDFFCAPFGAPSEYHGEKHHTHGEPAGRKWTLAGARKDGPTVCLTLTMNTKIRRGRITKRLILVEGHNVVYCRHSLEGFAGKMPLGHHATLALPTEDGSAQIATSPIRFAMTCPSPTGIPAEGSYYTLALGKRFKDLAGAPLIWADTKTGDCSALPARKGFTDVLAVFNKPSAAPAWTTATFENRRYMWFSLKDPAVLPSTVMWISNCGRHGAPWNGRNRCLGLEDVCAYFAEGLKASVQPNEISKAGIPTAIRLSPRRPTAINYIQGVTKIPRGFKKVQDAVFRPGEVTFTSTTAKTVTVKVDHEFLKSGEVC